MAAGGFHTLLTVAAPHLFRGMSLEIRPPRVSGSPPLGSPSYRLRNPASLFVIADVSHRLAGQPASTFALTELRPLLVLAVSSSENFFFLLSAPLPFSLPTGTSLYAVGSNSFGQLGSDAVGSTAYTFQLVPGPWDSATKPRQGL